MKVFRLNLIISICLIVGGFFCPPMGIIDGSVLTAVGLLLLFALLDKLPEAIRQGRTIKFQKGDINLEVTSEQTPKDGK